MASEQRRASSPQFSQPLDRVAILAIAILSIVIGILVLGGDHTAPRVRGFTWQDRQVGTEDTAFILTFSRPMNHASVEENLRLIPPLPGKFSWAGRRMAYTLEIPAPYGTAFELNLEDAWDRFSEPADNNPIQPFVGRFRTRDRAFVYLGMEGDEQGRLILNNLTRQETYPLTPPNLVVMDFKPYPDGDRILFSASERSSVQTGMLDQKLYTVTTGIHALSPALSPQEIKAGERPTIDRNPEPAGVVTEILDSQEYQNLKFDLAPDGEKVVIQRVNRADPGDFGLWLIQPEEPPQPLETEPGGDFLIAPDSSSLAMSQGQGLAILPLEQGAEPLDFLAKFGVILDFSNDGTMAATVQFDAEPNNPKRSLYVVTNQGEETELLETDGSILDAQFDPMKRTLYALVTKRIPDPELFLEEPYLVALNLKTGERTDLIKLPMQRDIQMSLSPDGLGILFDQTVAADPNQPDATIIRGSDGGAIAASRLWFYPINLDANGNPLAAQPEPLPMAGLRPKWLS